MGAVMFWKGLYHCPFARPINMHSSKEARAKKHPVKIFERPDDQTGKVLRMKCSTIEKFQAKTTHCFTFIWAEVPWRAIVVNDFVSGSYDRYFWQRGCRGRFASDLHNIRFIAGIASWITALESTGSSLDKCLLIIGYARIAVWKPVLSFFVPPIVSEIIPKDFLVIVEASHSLQVCAVIV